MIHHQTQASGKEATTTGSAARQGELWGARAADWAEVQEAVMRPLFEAVLAAAKVGPQTRLLDVGCGAGGAAALAASRGATVFGLDASQPLLDIARRRVPGGQFIHGDMESLPYETSSFDAIVGFNSFQYAGDPTNALREARRVARPRAPIAIATWGKPEDCQAAVTLVALKPLLPPPPPGSGGPFALSDEAVLREFVARAGLTPIEVADVPCPWIYPDLATALRGQLSAGPLVLAIRTSGESKVRETLERAIEPFRTPSGGYRIDNKFRYVIATA
jgi:ubiquinone/menaquinone biosynthesis C-methylase UbiE